MEASFYTTWMALCVQAKKIILYSDLFFSPSVVFNSFGPMDCNTPGSLPSHQPLQLAQTHVHWADAIQPSRPLSSCSLSAFCLPQHPGLCQWVGSHQVAKVVEFQLQHQFSQRIFRDDFLKDWLDGFLCTPYWKNHSFLTRWTFVS